MSHMNCCIKTGCCIADINSNRVVFIDLFNFGGYLYVNSGNVFESDSLSALADITVDMDILLENKAKFASLSSSIVKVNQKLVDYVENQQSFFEEYSLPWGELNSAVNLLKKYM